MRPHRGRPPWVPDGEPFPPRGPHWHGARRRFFWRMGCVFLVFVVLAVAGALTVASALLRLLAGERLAFPPEGVLAAGLALGGIALMGALLRRVASPLGDLMEASARVADGDYAARVRPRGPREMRSLVHAFNLMAERLQRNDEQRRALMADIAHELRTPLAVIQGQMEGVLDGVYARDDAHLAPVLEETRLLARLVEDLRTLALAESGALRLQIETVELSALANEALAAFRAQADAAGVTLAAHIADDAPAIEADPLRLREVLSNLLANALRYTPRGGRVEVRGRLLPAAGRVALAVSDTGAGIAPDALLHIFDRFYKSRDSSGSGLGLAIAKNLVEAHGGTIRAESAPGQGTTVTMEIPVGG